MIAPFQNPPPYEKLIGDLAGAYSRRINIQHRLVYQVYETERIIKVLRLDSLGMSRMPTLQRTRFSPGLLSGREENYPELDRVLPGVHASRAFQRTSRPVAAAGPTRDSKENT